MAGGNKCCFAGIAPSRNPIGHHVLTADMSVVSAILGKSGSSHWAPWDGSVPHLHAGEFLGPFAAEALLAEGVVEQVHCLHERPHLGRSLCRE